MKKILSITLVLLLTGCFGETGKGYITKNCQKQEHIGGINITQNIDLKSKEGIVTNLKITEKYETENNIDTIKESKKSEKNLYNTIDGIEMTINENIFIYEIDAINTTDFIKEKFNIKEEQHKMLKEYELQGYKCN